MGTRGSHFHKEKETPTAGGAAEFLHFFRDVGLLCSSTLLHSLALCLSVLSKLCHLRAELVVVPGTH